VLPALMLSLAVAVPGPRPALPVWIAPPADGRLAPVARFRGETTLPRKPDRALLRVLVQRRCRVAVNGRAFTVSDAVWGETFDVGSLLSLGRNRVEVVVEAEPARGPRNAWTIIERRLAAPVAADRLVFQTRGARADEWLYVEVVDAAGVASGYYCVERGRADFRLGTDGAPRDHALRLREEPTLPTVAAGTRCDFGRIAAVRVRVDQKDSWSRPSGGVTLEAVRLEGDASVDLGGAAAWRMMGGVGDQRRTSVRPEAGGLRVAYDYTPAPDPRLSVDLRAFDGAREVGRLVSGPEWTVDGGPARVTDRPSNGGALYAEYAPLDIRDTRERVSTPYAATVSASLANGSDRVVEGRPFVVAARVWALAPGRGRWVRLRVEDWSGRQIASLRAPVRWRGESGDASFRVAGLPRGLHRFTLRLDGAPSGPERRLAVAALPAGATRVSTVFGTLRPFTRLRRGLQGVDLSYFDSPALLLGLRDLGVNFLQFHIEPHQLDNGELEELIAFCRATRTRFALNNETANWVASARRADGSDRFEAAEGCHRWDIELPALRKAAASGLFEGVVYDEGEHMQLCRNFYANLPDPVRRKPYLVETDGLSLQQAHAAFVAAARRVAAHNRAGGARMLVESVFPVLWHPLAQAGVTLSPKLLKEDIHPVVLAMALGASLQYGSDLWFSPDLWHIDQLPGHSVREYAQALRVADQAGVDKVYTEFVTCLVRWRGGEYDITPYGRALRRHIAALARRGARGYTHRDYRPEVAIVRFPDSDWGQASCGYWNMLYGSPTLQSTPETREWLSVWSLLTGGVTHPGAVNTNSGVYDRYLWQGVIPSPAVAVFDHTVGDAPLSSVRTLFVCGIEVSAHTLEAVRRRVRAGATCFISERLCPVDVAAAVRSAPRRVAEGRGAWIVVREFTREGLGRWVSMVPAHGGAMRLRFGSRLVRAGE